MSIKTFLSYSHFTGHVVVKYRDSNIGMVALGGGSSGYVIRKYGNYLITKSYILDNILIIEVFV